MRFSTALTVLAITVPLGGAYVPSRGVKASFGGIRKATGPLKSSVDERTDVTTLRREIEYIKQQRERLRSEIADIQATESQTAREIQDLKKMLHSQSSQTSGIGSLPSMDFPNQLFGGSKNSAEEERKNQLSPQNNKNNNDGNNESKSFPVAGVLGAGAVAIGASVLLATGQFSEAFNPNSMNSASTATATTTPIPPRVVFMPETETKEPAKSASVAVSEPKKDIDNKPAAKADSVAPPKTESSSISDPVKTPETKSESKPEVKTEAAVEPKKAPAPEVTKVESSAAASDTVKKPESKPAESSSKSEVTAAPTAETPAVSQPAKEAERKIEPEKKADAEKKSDPVIDSSTPAASPKVESAAAAAAPEAVKIPEIKPVVEATQSEDVKQVPLAMNEETESSAVESVSTPEAVATPVVAEAEVSAVSADPVILPKPSEPTVETVAVSEVGSAAADMAVAPSVESSLAEIDLVVPAREQLFESAQEAATVTEVVSVSADPIAPAAESSTVSDTIIPGRDIVFEAAAAATPAEPISEPIAASVDAAVDPVDPVADGSLSVSDSLIPDRELVFETASEAATVSEVASVAPGPVTPPPAESSADIPDVAVVETSSDAVIPQVTSSMDPMAASPVINDPITVSDREESASETAVPDVAVVSADPVVTPALEMPDPVIPDRELTFGLTEDVASAPEVSSVSVDSSTPPDAAAAEVASENVLGSDIVRDQASAEPQQDVASNEGVAMSSIAKAYAAMGDVVASEPESSTQGA